MSTRAHEHLKEERRKYAAAFKTKDGKAVLQDLMRRFNVSRPHLTSDPIELAMLEGERSVVLHILTMVRMSETELEALLRKQPTMIEMEDE